MINKKVLLLLALFLLNGCSKKEDVAIIVNGEKILQSHIEEAAEIIHNNMVRAVPQKALEGVDAELLKGSARQLVANEVLYGEAKKRKLDVDSVLIDTTIQKIKQQFADYDAYKKELESMGETEVSMRKHLEKGALIDSMLKIVTNGADTVSEQECLDFYNKDSSRFMSKPEIRVSQIFFKVDTSRGKAVVDSINKIASGVCEKAKKGEDFIALGKKYSNAESVLCGDLGWFKKGDLRKDLESSVADIKVGEVGDLVSSENGFHILKKTDERASAVMSFEQVRGQIRSMMTMKKQSDHVVNFIDSLISKSKIQYLNEKYRP